MSDVTRTVLAAIPASMLFVFLFHLFFVPDKRPRPPNCKACKTLWKTARFDDGHLEMGAPLTVTYRPRKTKWFWAFLPWRKR